jgi:hypothetical protein
VVLLSEWSDPSPDLFTAKRVSSRGFFLAYFKIHSRACRIQEIGLIYVFTAEIAENPYLSMLFHPFGKSTFAHL